MCVKIEQQSHRLGSFGNSSLGIVSRIPQVSAFVSACASRVGVRVTILQMESGREEGGIGREDGRCGDSGCSKPKLGAKQYLSSPEAHEQPPTQSRRTHSCSV